MVSFSISIYGLAEVEIKGQQENIELRMPTATPGGTWYPIGVGIAEIIMREIPGVVVSVGSGGSQANIKALEQGSADLAMLFSADMALAQKGGGPFKELVENMRDLVKLFASPYQMTVRRDSGIETFYDLKGKRVGTVQVGTGGEYMTRVILEAHGITYDDIKIQHAPNSDLINMMKDRQLDAAGWTGGIPFPIVVEVGSFDPVKLLSIDAEIQEKIMNINSGYTPYVIPEGTYADQGNPEEVHTLSMTTRLGCSPNLPDELVYKIVEAIGNNLEDLGNIVHTMKNMKAEDMYQDIGVPLHPGAKEYYSSLGIEFK